MKRVASVILMLGVGALASLAASGAKAPEAVGHALKADTVRQIVQDKDSSVDDLMVLVHRQGLPAGHGETAR